MKGSFCNRSFNNMQKQNIEYPPFSRRTDELEVSLNLLKAGQTQSNEQITSPSSGMMTNNKLNLLERKQNIIS